jgi:hypothetical protein
MLGVGRASRRGTLDVRAQNEVGAVRIGQWTTRRRLAMVVCTTLIAGGLGVAVAMADMVSPDGDDVTTTSGVGTGADPIQLGNVAPGATINTQASFKLECFSAKHVDVNQSVSVTFHSATITTSTDAPAAGSATATNAAIGPVPGSWPDDTTGAPNCGATPPTLPDNGNSLVTITAPTTAGSYKAALLFKNATSNTDPAGVQGETTVHYTFTVVANSAPNVGTITGATSVTEADHGANAKTYSVTASDPDSDPLTYAWSITAGSAGASISGASTGSSVSVDFTDGPQNVTLQVIVDDGHGHTVTRTLGITEANVAPTVTFLTGPTSANEGDTKNYTYSVTDPGNDPNPTITESCGSGTKSAALTGFDCMFPDGPASSDVTVTADDGDPSNNVGSASRTVSIANVAPTITNFTVTVPTGAACQGATNSVSVSFGVSDPADEAHDPITGTITWGGGTPATDAISGRTVSKSHLYGAGTYTLTVDVDDGDGGTDADGTTGNVKLLYATSGLLQPINADKSSNFKLGSTFPIKIRVTDCNGASVGTLAPDVGLVKVGAGGGVVNEVDVQSVPDAGTDMRYDATAGQYIYNLSSKRSTLIVPAGAPLDLGSYRVSVSDPTIATAFGFFDIVK